MKIAGVVVAVILFVYSILLIGQIWGDWMKWSTFIKVSITAGVIVVAIGIIALIIKEISEEKTLKDNNYLD